MLSFEVLVILEDTFFKWPGASCFVSVLLGPWLAARFTAWSYLMASANSSVGVWLLYDLSFLISLTCCGMDWGFWASSWSVLAFSVDALNFAPIMVFGEKILFATYWMTFF